MMRIQYVFLSVVMLSIATCTSESVSSDTAVHDDSMRELRRLERRQTTLEDAQSIERLQHAYGYYIDRGFWNEAADLFAEDGTIENGLDGVYAGRDRVRAYLFEHGGGQDGLSNGQLHEHMQLMPVVTIGRDGATARGRWRALILLGKLGEQAVWGEGPYENDYVKEDGIWKIQTLHWYQSMVVPYAGGWQLHSDVNAGKWVSDRLPPDAPPTVDYATWPGVFLPPFHFDHPIAGDAARPSKGESSRETLSAEAFTRRAGRLARRIQRLEDTNAIERLQRVYGYYIDKGMWSEAAALFAETGTLEEGQSGLFAGRTRILEYLRRKGPEFPAEGWLRDHMQLQPIVHVDADGKTAHGRFRLFAQEAVWGEYARWGVGIYENTYVKEAGIWKLQSLHVYPTMYTPYEDGWGVSALPVSSLTPALPPDEPPTVVYEAYPESFVVPFHYENPVTHGALVERSDANTRDPGSPAVTLESLAHRLERLEDVDAIERLHAIYGYYLASNSWDELAALFSVDGTIEIALRGIYVGPESVRRSLDLYGSAGTAYGRLHNHMQFQPVIDVDEDGRSARMRSRAFSIMGQYEANSMWMGGIYENEFVKEDGAWKIQRDHIFNTYFAIYPVGWKDLVPRNPPGASSDVPPDLPPSTQFSLYPGAFLPPYHYDNPVTGQAAATSR